MPEVPKRIHLLGDGRHEEIVAAGAIRPGALLVLTTAGKVTEHATAGGYAERLFALEDALQGKEISESYAADDVVGIVVAQPGDVVYAYLSWGEDVETGELLTSNGDGALKVATGSDKPIAVALEDLDLSDSESADERLRVRIL
jgi:hypothetical protein